MKLNKLGYQQLIDEDIAWLKANAPDTLERQHIILTLEYSVEEYYPTKIHCPECNELVYKRDIELGLHQMTGCHDYEDHK